MEHWRRHWLPISRVCVSRHSETLMDELLTMIFVYHSIRKVIVSFIIINLLPLLLADDFSPSPKGIFSSAKAPRDRGIAASEPATTAARAGAPGLAVAERRRGGLLASRSPGPAQSHASELRQGGTRAPTGPLCPAVRLMGLRVRLTRRAGTCAGAPIVTLGTSAANRCAERHARRRGPRLGFRARASPDAAEVRPSFGAPSEPGMADAPTAPGRPE